MKKLLVVGLGNVNVATDAIGIQVAQALAERADLPDDLEIICAGTDLLRVADQLRGRDIIVLIDAAVSPDDAAGVVFCEHGSPQLANVRQHAHHLSAVQALDLIRWSDDSVRRALCFWYLPIVSAPDTAAQTGL